MFKDGRIHVAHSMCLVAVMAGFVLAMSGVYAEPARAVEIFSVTVASPNGGAKVTGRLYFYTKTTWQFEGELKDTSCNSHDVYVDVWKNRRWGWEHHEAFWIYHAGVYKVGNVRWSGGCNTARDVSFYRENDAFNVHDIGFAVCDDGFRDSCSSASWPENWYGVYHNPYTPY